MKLNALFSRMQPGILAVTLLFGGRPPTATGSQLYVSDYGAGSISRYIASGLGKTFASIPDCQGLAFDPSGVLYVASYTESKIYEVGGGGSITTFASGRQIENPSFIIFDSAGNLFVSHGGSQPGIAKVTPDGSITKFASRITPADLAFDSAGYLYAIEQDDDNVGKYAPDGTRSLLIGGFGHPTGLAFDAFDNLFVSDALYKAIYKVTPDGRRTTFATGLVNPMGMAVDGTGNLFVAEYLTILKFAPDGTGSTFATGLSSPWDVAFRP